MSGDSFPVPQRWCDMAIIVTVDSPEVISVVAIAENEYNVVVDEPSPINITAALAGE